MAIIYVLYTCSIAATISFNQSMYSVGESEGSVQLVLDLSNPSSTNFTVGVTDRRNTVTGEEGISVLPVSTKYHNR